MLGINQHIFSVLSQVTALTNIVGTNIFPLVVDKDVPAPVIMLQRASLSGNYTNTGRTNDNAVSDIFCIAESYKQSITIADMVRGTLETYKDSNIINCKLTGAEESYDPTNGLYIQLLTFNITTK